MSLRILAVKCPCGATAADHFDGPSCGREPIPPALIRSILSRERADERHADGRLTVTRLLSCPRQAAICDFIGITFDPRRHASMHLGTIIHEQLARYAPEGCGEVVVEGEIGGVCYSGAADVLTPELIEDYKVHSETSQRWKVKGAHKHPNDEDAQLSLLQLAAGGPPRKLRAIHLAMTAKDGPPMQIVSESEPMTEEELLNYRPKGGVSSVKDHIGDWQDLLRPPSAGMIGRMPLRGQSQFGGKGCDYCVARETCDALEAGK